MDNHQAREVKTGYWLYDKETPMTVKIFVLNYDYYYELAKADDMLDKDEKPELNKWGETYMIKWGGGDFFDNDLVTMYFGGLDLETAIKIAEDKITGLIIWKG